MPLIAETQNDALELSVVMPCLNEADTLEVCVCKALKAMSAADVVGEVIVADNGSTDGSQDIARRLGARVVDVAARGYGAALQGGIEASKGRFVIMGDADDSYDFTDIPRFVEQLREGFELVMGCRLPSGGGTVAEGAMPTLHRWWGNPMFSAMVRRMFRAPIHDVYCGLRGFTRELYDRLDLRCTGMEFATEMVIKSSLFHCKITEIPITLHPDGRKAHKPHLRTFQDGWRTLRFFMLYSPRWLFFVPGAVSAALGILLWAFVFLRVPIFGASLDAHSLLFGSLFLLLGYQSTLFGVLSKLFAINERLLPDDHRLDRFLKVFSLERCAMGGFVLFVLAGGTLLHAFHQWQSVGFGAMDYSVTMRWVVPGTTLAALSFQTVLSSLFISVLGLKHR